MTNLVNDIFRQAQQGSVAAVIQVLNEKLADSGVRTRAIFIDGILQLLCEAATPEQLEQSSLTPRVQQILEAIAPRNIRRVNINSRIVCEQQLLWLDEIHRNPEKLLWSEEITLKKLRFFQQWQQEQRWKKSDSLADLSTTISPRRHFQEERPFLEKRPAAGNGLLIPGVLLTGAALALLALGVVPLGLFKKSAPTTTAASGTAADSNLAVKPTASSAVVPGSQSAAADPFADAVRLAEKASQQGTRAGSAAEWLTIAAYWQQASDLMGQVPATDPRYKASQVRVAAYRTNSEVALQSAQKARSPLP